MARVANEGEGGQLFSDYARRSSRSCAEEEAVLSEYTCMPVT